MDNFPISCIVYGQQFEFYVCFFLVLLRFPSFSKVLNKVELVVIFYIYPLVFFKFRILFEVYLENLHIIRYFLRNENWISFEV